MLTNNVEKRCCALASFCRETRKLLMRNMLDEFDDAVSRRGRLFHFYARALNDVQSHRVVTGRSNKLINKCSRGA